MRGGIWFAFSDGVGLRGILTKSHLCPRDGLHVIEQQGELQRVRVYILSPINTAKIHDQTKQESMKSSESVHIIFVSSLYTDPPLIYTHPIIHHPSSRTKQKEAPPLLHPQPTNPPHRPARPSKIISLPSDPSSTQPHHLPLPQGPLSRARNPSQTTMKRAWI